MTARTLALWALAVAIACIIALMLIPAGAPEPGYEPHVTITLNR